jgi:uncharacterized membrane protein
MSKNIDFLDEHDPTRKEFQIDRIILFSDAVFAIAITLLVIEIKSPVISKGEADNHIVNGLLDLMPRFIGFIISFFVIAVYWRNHHRIFGFVHGYSEKLIWINMIFLLTIVLMPFSSAYYSENFLYGIPFYFYSCNIIFTGIVNYWLITHVFSKKSALIKHHPTEKFLKVFKLQSLATPIVFLLGMIISPYFPVISRFAFLLTWPVARIIKRVYT